MPRVTRESFNVSEADDNKKENENVSVNSSAFDGAADNNAAAANAASASAASARVGGVVNVVSGDASSNGQNSATVIRRRRSGRRVVRVAGAAGESMKLHVEGGVNEDSRADSPVSRVDSRADSATSADNSSAQSQSQSQSHIRPITSLLFQEPVLPQRAHSASSSDLDSSYEGSNSSRDSRSQSESKRSSRDSRNGRKLSGSGSDFSDNLENKDDFSEDSNRSSRKSRKTRSSKSSAKGKVTRESFDENYDLQDDDTQLIRVRSRANRDDKNARIERDGSVAKDELQASDSDRSDRSDRSDYASQNSRKTRKNRRLNAAERRAAAEVEQIEEDLEYDDITYAPIENRKAGKASRRLDEGDFSSDFNVDFEDGFSNDSGSNRNDNADLDEDYAKESDLQDDEDGVVTRRRRRRRSSRVDRADRADRSSRADNANNSNDSEDSSDSFDSGVSKYDVDEIEVSQEDRNLIPDPEELQSQDEGIYTRRRRRRRSKSADDSSQSDQSRFDTVETDSQSRRSRKQQYIDEITDIEGSTRLEAKKQRRRDNRRERNRQNLLMEQDFLARRENVDRLMVVRERDRHTQISVIEDNILVEHYVSDIQEVATVGNIYLGRVQNVLPSMEAAFVDIGQARNGVLYAGEVNWDATRLEGQPRRMELAFKAGDPVLVQVTKDPIGHKGARLTSQVTLAGRFLVLVPSGAMTGVSRKLSDRERSRLRAIVSKIAPKDMGVIIRTAADGASEEAIEKDLESLVKQWDRIEAKRQEFLHGKRPKLLQGEPDVAIRVVRDIFNDDFQKMIVEGQGAYDRICEYLEMMAPDLRSKIEYWDPAEHEGKDVFDKWQIDSQLRKGMERQVYLPAGGSIVIDRTEAMTTIDVNTGRFIGRGKSLEETVTRCNLEASEEIARQLRLRDIGGMVMIDYVDMVMPANRDLVLRRLVECLARDRTKHQVAEVTSLGLVQMTRKRVGQGLVEAFSEECPTCKGRGFILHDEPTVSSEYADPYALKGGDPFIKTNKHGHGSLADPIPTTKQESSADVRAKLAKIAAAAASSAFFEESLRKSLDSGKDDKDEAGDFSIDEIEEESPATEELQEVTSESQEASEELETSDSPAESESQETGESQETTDESQEESEESEN
ncbi:Rne/Rng family ribonuclease [Gardnerella vaginalis]|uniref:Ribonuclease E n=1 Tax=Gardnerella vaginalis TaxID=2702 RepID=A0A133NRF6_GARVA|nr:Rne/Rng family ribonuclease [Gardnerella vaginalis]KXA18872.1 ribonuclease, Rne/Rng family [Gardnerella vaginalis]